MTKQTKEKQKLCPKDQTILNSSAPNDLAVVKSSSEWPKHLLKLILALIILGLVCYYFFK